MPGGVCAVLDYEVEAMAEYVADMATRLVTPEASVTPQFRQFVSQILTSTRLPSTTILLGMNYLAKRINGMKSRGPYEASHGQVWRFLTVSLLLASKFLDDNTFQNRSWSEVSGIAVAELNSLEYHWLQAMNWKLYVNLDHSKDYQAWLENWREWQQIKKRQVAHASRDRLSTMVPSIDTNLSRFGQRHSTHSQYTHQRPGEYPQFKGHQPYRSREAAWAHNPWNAPLTPPDSGYGTPEYGMSATSANARYNEWFSQATAQYSRYSQAPHGSYYPHRPVHYSANYSYTPNSWEHGLAECSCPNCLGSMKHSNYFTNHGYGQPVMG